MLQLKYSLAPFVSHPKTALWADIFVMLKILSSEVSAASNIKHMPAVIFFLHALISTKIASFGIEIT